MVKIDVDISVETWQNLIKLQEECYPESSIAEVASKLVSLALKDLDMEALKKQIQEATE